MKTVMLNSKVVELYDDIAVLPVNRYHVFNKMLLIDSGCGSDLNDFDAHIERLRVFVRTDPDEAAKELDNLRQNVYFIQNNLSPRMLAFAALVAKINGNKCEDVSTEGLKKVVEEISGEPYSEVIKVLDDIKKKVDEELQLYFPDRFNDVTVREFYDVLKRRTVLLLNGIINERFEETEITKLTETLITYAKPEVFNGSENAEIQHDKHFETMCLMLSEHFHVQPKSFTVLEFYNAYEQIIKIQIEREKALKSNRS